MKTAIRGFCPQSAQRAAGRYKYKSIFPLPVSRPKVPPGRKACPVGFPQNGFSLLEVILALTILGVSLAILGELARWGLRHAGYARDMTQAQLLCESKMSEIVAGMFLPETVVDAPFAAEDLIDPNDPVGWVYTVELAETDQPGLVAVAVSVSQNLPPERKPIRCTLVRWIPDPGIQTYDIAGEAASEALQTQQNSSSGSMSLDQSTGGSNQ